ASPAAAPGELRAQPDSLRHVAARYNIDKSASPPPVRSTPSSASPSATKLQRGLGSAAAVLLDQRQDPCRCVVLIDHLALSRQALQVFEEGRGAVAHVLHLIPLRGIGHGDADQRLEALESIPWYAQVIPRQG